MVQGYTLLDPWQIVPILEVLELQEWHAAMVQH